MASSRPWLCPGEVVAGVDVGGGVESSVWTWSVGVVVAALAPEVVTVLSWLVVDASYSWPSSASTWWAA